MALECVRKQGDHISNVHRESEVFYNKGEQRPRQHRKAFFIYQFANGTKMNGDVII